MADLQANIDDLWERREGLGPDAADALTTVRQAVDLLDTSVHLSGGVGIGGVLEPAQAAPVVVEDEAFVGSRCMVTEGARVGEGAVVGSGVIVNPSVPVIDAETGAEVSRGVIPPWCVAI